MNPEKAINPIDIFEADSVWGGDFNGAIIDIKQIDAIVDTAPGMAEVVLRVSRSECRLRSRV